MAVARCGGAPNPLGVSLPIGQVQHVVRCAGYGEVNTYGSPCCCRARERWSHEGTPSVLGGCVAVVGMRIGGYTFNALALLRGLCVCPQPTWPRTAICNVLLPIPCVSHALYQLALAGLEEFSYLFSCAPPHGARPATTYFNKLSYSLLSVPQRTPPRGRLDSRWIGWSCPTQ